MIHTRWYNIREEIEQSGDRKAIAVSLEGLVNFRCGDYQSHRRKAILEEVIRILH